MPTPSGNITSSNFWDGQEPELVSAEACPCFTGGTCPTEGKHKE